MSKSKKKKKKSAQANAAPSASKKPAVNTLGIDVEPAEEPAPDTLTTEFQPEDQLEAPVEFSEENYEDADVCDFSAQENEPEEDEDQPFPYTIVDKIINYATLALSMLLLGGSLVFWWIISKHLILSPSKLVDSEQMLAILICSTITPIIVAVIQTLLKRPVSIERWLICMCISGALSALIIIIYQMGIRDMEFTFSDFPTLICCTVSACTLPAALCTLVRRYAPRVIGYFRKNAADSSMDNWDEISENITSLTDFDI